MEKAKSIVGILLAMFAGYILYLSVDSVFTKTFTYHTIHINSVSEDEYFTKAKYIMLCENFIRKEYIDRAVFIGHCTSIKTFGGHRK